MLCLCVFVHPLLGNVFFPLLYLVTKVSILFAFKPSLTLFGAAFALTLNVHLHILLLITLYCDDFLSCISLLDCDLFVGWVHDDDEQSTWFYHGVIIHDRIQPLNTDCTTNNKRYGEV